MRTNLMLRIQCLIQVLGSYVCVFVCGIADRKYYIYIIYTMVGSRCQCLCHVRSRNLIQHGALRANVV